MFELCLLIQLSDEAGFRGGGVSGEFGGTSDAFPADIYGIVFEADHAL